MTLTEMRKLLPGLSAAGMSQIQPQTAAAPSPKDKGQQMMDSLKDCLQDRKVQEAIAAAAKIVVPTPEVSAAIVPEAILKGKAKEKGSKSRAASSDPASQRSGKKKEKAPTPEVEELEEEEESTAEDTTELGEEELPSTPLPDQQPKDRETRFSSKKKPGPLYRSPFAPKHQSKMPGKGKGSSKKPRGK